MRILLTGATGFVGRHVLKALKRRGLHVTVVVRPGRADAAADADEFIETPDLFTEPMEFWLKPCAQHDAVVHVAWYAEPGSYQNSLLNFSCVAGTLRLAEAAAKTNLQRFVGVGTCFEYDLFTSALKQHQPLTSLSPLGPVTPYGAAKASVWLALSQGFMARKTEFAWCRLFYLYGEGEDPRRLVPYVRNCLQQGEPVLLSNGKRILDYLDVSEAGDYLADVTESTEQGVFNICSGKAISLRDFVINLANPYDRLDLLQFGAKEEAAPTAPYVVGVPGLVNSFWC